MSLQRQSVNINFSKGLNLKDDPWQVPVGNFLALSNSVFTTGGRLTKRNGYKNLAALPSSNFPYVTTFNNDLTAIGESIAAYSADTAQWVSKGSIQPVGVSTIPIIRNSLNQTQCDSVTAPSGLSCIVYTETTGVSTDYKYAIIDSVTGQNIVTPTVIVGIGAGGAVIGSPRVFLLSSLFVIMFTEVISSASHLQFITVSAVNPTVVTAPRTLVSSAYNANPDLSWDGVVINVASSQSSTLYVAYSSTAGGNSVYVVSILPTLTVSAPVPITGYLATLMSVCADVTDPVHPRIYVNWYTTSGHLGYTAILNQNLTVVVAPLLTINNIPIANLTSCAQNGAETLFYEVLNNYGYDATIPTNYVQSASVTITSPTTATTAVIGVVVRGVGLASKAFIVNGVEYFLAAFQSPYQPSYFLINGSVSTEIAPVVVAKLAYENGGGYLTTGLPSVTVTENTAQVAYLYKDLVEPLATLDNPEQTTSVAVYSQTGINLASFTLSTQNIDTVEMGNNLNLSGGFLGLYDGYQVVENGFFLWPDSVECTWHDTGGFLIANPSGWVSGQPSYYYQVIYSWTDNQGNTFRSAPSIPVPITLGSDSSAHGSVTVNVPTLRLTYKTDSPVIIQIYRWSIANQIYYEVTSPITPLLNNPAVDSVSFLDVSPDTGSGGIVGNAIIYTNGGVVEDINGPATNIMSHFDTRLWLVDAEDPNLLWYSKQVIENTPVEMSDLFTMYISPTIASQGSVGPITALAPLDDKLIIFFKNAIYYINGVGPDNTGANSQYSQPLFVTATIGCTNQESIVFMPSGLMFQSDKGVWTLGRDLSTQYTGAAIEKYNSATVETALNIPGTNQVRFTLNNGVTLVYDYYWQQWGTFNGVPALSSTLFQNLHTCIDSFGRVFQETPGLFLDGDSPVLMSFTTSWLNLAGLQGYTRAYFFYLLGQYLSPHFLDIDISYDYNPSPLHSVTIQPDNFSPYYGTGVSQSPYGAGTTYGGPLQKEQWRVFLKQQRCESFQITLSERYDASLGVPAGGGLTLSGLNVMVGVKRDVRLMPAKETVGVS